MSQRHLHKLITDKQRRLEILKEKEARLGLNTPPETIMDIQDLAGELEELRAQLAAQTEAPALPVSPAKPSIFISYSHKDEIWKERLVTQLQVLALENLFEVWDDRQIAAGEAWQAEIEAAIERASLAVLLVSANFLVSPFIRSKEVPRLLNRRAGRGLRVYPLIISPCPWQRVEWLARMQVRPRDGRPLAAGNDYQVDETLANIALEIESMLR